MRGIISHGAYLPHRRLDRSTIAAVAGTGGGKGTRTVASYDEDTTTLGVEAARLALRVPSWCPTASVRVDGEEVALAIEEVRRAPHTAAGLTPHEARWGRIELPAGATEAVVDLDLALPVRARRQDERLPQVGGTSVITRGPLVYCLEGVDHPGRSVDDLFSVVVDPDALEVRPAPDLVEGAVALHGTDAGGRPVRLVPYFLWGNRAPGPMTAFVGVSAG